MTRKHRRSRRLFRQTRRIGTTSDGVWWGGKEQKPIVTGRQEGAKPGMEKEKDDV